MTTSTNTSNPVAGQSVPEVTEPAFAGAVDEATLSRLANELFRALPNEDTFDPALPAASPYLPQTSALNNIPIAGAILPRPNEDVLRTAPAGAAGLTGQAPSQYVTQPSSVSTVDRPIANATTLFDTPPVSSSLQSYSRTVRPADHPTVPGVRFGSVPSRTPGLEVGAMPITPRVPPAAAFGAPDERVLRDVPGVLSGLGGIGGVTPPGAETGSDLFYFLPESAGTHRLQTPGVPAPNAPASAPDFNQTAATEVPVGSVPTAGRPEHIDVGDAVPSLPDASEAHYFLGESTSLQAEANRASQATLGPVREQRAVREVDVSADDPHPGFDVNAVRRDFPILSEQVNGRPLIWLDNAATTQKPQSVIDRLSYFYEHENSNIHRAAHALAARATDAYEAARKKVAGFLNASSAEEIVFVRGTTEGINLLAHALGQRHIQEGDEIILTHLEHHANIVPWQLLCKATGARLRIAPVDDTGQILLDDYERLFNKHTRLVSFSQVSNALGTVTPAQEMVDIAHRHGACVLVDGAQAVSHMAVDVQALNCDYYVFSGHKVFGPTGIGAVYGRKELLDSLPPYQGGGNMIVDVTFERSIFQPAPGRFEAGTGNIADAVGLGAAIDYVQRLGMDNIAAYEHALLEYATEGLHSVPGLRIIGTAQNKASVLSFVLDGYKSEELGEALNREGIAVRSGHHCAQPILRRFGLETTVRPSLAFYNTCEEVDALVGALLRLQGGRTTLHLA